MAPASTSGEPSRPVSSVRLGASRPSSRQRLACTRSSPLSASRTIFAWSVSNFAFGQCERMSSFSFASRRSNFSRITSRAASSSSSEGRRLSNSRQSASCTVVQCLPIFSPMRRVLQPLMARRTASATHSAFRMRLPATGRLGRPMVDSVGITGVGRPDPIPPASHRLAAPRVLLALYVHNTRFSRLQSRDTSTLFVETHLILGRPGGPIDALIVRASPVRN